MVKVVIIKKNCDLKCSSVKNLTLENLYKKCGLSTNKHFGKCHTWEYENNYYTLYAKNNGKAGSENKYELPPPVDEKLYFGNMIMLKHKNEEIVLNEILDLNLEEFVKVRNHFFGGFDDLDEEDSYSEDEEIPEQYKTKEGYSKEDGFIVSTDDEDDIEFEDLEETDGDEEYEAETDYGEEEESDEKNDENSEEESEEESEGESEEESEENSEEDSEEDDVDYLTEESYSSDEDHEENDSD